MIAVTDSASRLRYGAHAACLVLVIGLWLPWASLSVTVVGHPTLPFDTYSGTQMGDDFLSLPTGWIAAIVGAITLFAIRAPAWRAAFVGALVAAVDLGYTILAMPSTIRPEPALGYPRDALVGHVGYEWGVFVVAAGSLALVAIAGWFVRTTTVAP